MATITISGKDLIQGESSADWVPDKGFSPSSYSLNLTRIRGVLDFAPTQTDRGSSTLTANIIASCPDTKLSGNDALFLDSSGSIYTLQTDDTFTKRQTISGYTSILGTSDMIQYSVSGNSNNASLASLFVTTETTVHMYGGSSANEPQESAGQPEWWVGLQSGVRHPMEIVEGNVYLGDFNLIHTWNATTSTAALVTLPYDVNITSLRKHPNGRHLIAFCGVGQNASHTRNTPGRAYIVDPTIRYWVKEIDIEYQVEGSRDVGGVIYVTYGNKVGYFNGEGITHIKTLANSSTTYSHNLSNMEDILLVRDGIHVRAFGDLGGGRVWWRCATTATGTENDINCITYRGDNKLLIAYTDSGSAPYLKEIDYDNTGSTGIFFSNRYVFPNKVMIRKIEVVHDKAAGSFAFTYNDPDDSVVTLLPAFTTLATQGKTEIQVNLETDIFQFRIGQGPGELRLIRIHYEPI